MTVAMTFMRQDCYRGFQFLSVAVPATLHCEWPLLSHFMSLPAVNSVLYPDRSAGVQLWNRVWWPQVTSATQCCSLWLYSRIALQPYCLRWSANFKPVVGHFLNIFTGSMRRSHINPSFEKF